MKRVKFIDSLLEATQKLITEKPLFTSIIYVGFFLTIIFYGYLPIGYDTNDDISMILATKGVGYFSEPTELVSFSNVIYGKYLKFFSIRFPQVNFYTINTYLLLLGSEILITYLILKFNIKYSIKILFLMSNIFFMLIIFSKLQFTITCSLVFIAGILSLIYGLIKQSKIMILIGVLISLLATLIRFNQTLVLFVFIAPLIYVFTKEYGNKFILKTTFIILLIFSVGYSLFSYNKYVYKQKYHSNFIEDKKKMFVLFYDYNMLARTSKALKNAFMKRHHISQNDHNLYHCFFFVPNGFLNPQSISESEISKIRYAVRAPVKSLSESLSEFANVFFILSLLTIIVTTISVTHKSKRREHIDFIIAYILYFIVLTQAFNFLFKPLPYRVYFSIIFCVYYLVYLMLQNIDTQNDENDLKSKKYLFLLLGIFLVFYSFIVLGKNIIGFYQTQGLFFGINSLLLIFVMALIFYSFIALKKHLIKIYVSYFLFVSSITQLVFFKSSSRVQKSIQQSCESKLGSLDKSVTYFTFTSSLHLETLNPFDNFNCFADYKLLPIAISSTHPMVLKANPRYANNFADYLIDEKSQLIIETTQLSALECLRIYYLEHYNLKIDMIEVENSVLNKKDIHTYKLRKALS